MEECLASNVGTLYAQIRQVPENLAEEVKSANETLGIKLKMLEVLKKRKDSWPTEFLALARGGQAKKILTALTAYTDAHKVANTSAAPYSGGIEQAFANDAAWISSEEKVVNARKSIQLCNLTQAMFNKAAEDRATRVSNLLAKCPKAGPYAVPEQLAALAREMGSTPEIV